MSVNICEVFVYYHTKIFLNLSIVLYLPFPLKSVVTPRILQMVTCSEVLLPKTILLLTNFPLKPIILLFLLDFP